METTTTTPGHGQLGSHKHKFTPAEDIKLAELVAVHGESNWTTIAELMPNRNVRQCRERWSIYLSPAVKTGPWSEAEDSLLVNKFKEIGPKWKKLEEFLPGRTDISIKNHYWTLFRRQSPAGGSGADDNDAESTDGQPLGPVASADRPDANLAVGSDPSLNLPPELGGCKIWTYSFSI
jgi:hypothetical protein